jgi:hypothetical protein
MTIAADTKAKLPGSGTAAILVSGELFVTDVVPSRFTSIVNAVP